MRNRIIVMYKGAEKMAFAAEIVNNMSDGEAFTAMEKKHPDADLFAIVEDSLFKRRARPSKATAGGSIADADEYGALKGTAAWNALSTAEKSAISKARNKAASEAAKK